MHIGDSASAVGIGHAVGQHHRCIVRLLATRRPRQSGGAAHALDEVVIGRTRGIEAVQGEAVGASTNDLRSDLSQAFLS